MQLAIIENPHALALPSQGKEILRRMFVDYTRIIVEQEIGGGFSEGRIFVVRPFKANNAELLAVVKMAPTPLIEQERQAYQNYIHNRLPNAPELQATVYTGDETWAGLRYPLVGGGIFEIQSLFDYINRQDIDPEQLEFTFNERLLKSMGHLWRANEARQGFSIQGSYDYVLPVNLTLRPLSPTEIEALDDSPRRITPDNITAAKFKVDDMVRLEKFVITRIEIAANQTDITLNHPRAANDPANSYRLRIQARDTQPVTGYEVGKTTSITAQVINTRAMCLQDFAQRAVGRIVDLNQEWLSVPLPGKPISAPNPLRVYPTILKRAPDVRIAHAIHGDFNLENILVDPHTGDVNLIDFADARRDYVLHDLLRLESGIITRLLPLTLTEAKLTAPTIHTIYQQLHQAVVHNAYFNPRAIAPELEKPLTILLAIRQAARRYLFDYDNFTEYYQGLTLYLLGTLKFDNLNRIPKAKATAFWGAATLADLAREPLRTVSKPISTVQPTPEPAKPAVKKSPLLWLGMSGLAILLLGLLIVAGIWAGHYFFTPPPPDSPLIATVIGLHPQVQRQTIGTDRLAQVDFGADLYQGDILYTLQNASVNIACTNGLLLHLPEQRNMEVVCVEDQSVAEVIGRLDQGITQLIKIADTRPTDINHTIQRATTKTNQPQAPRLLMFRNSHIADSRPTFRWQPVEGAAGYRITITLPNGESWTRETTGTMLVYPPDVPPLEPGNFDIEITTLDDPTGTVIDKSVSALLDENTLTQITEAETNIRNLPLDAAGQHYLLAQLYIQHNMWPAAIEQLTTLIEMQPASSAGLWQQLGDLYLEIELYPSAQESYTEALDAAEQNNDPIARAGAHIGLAYTAIAAGNTEQAIQHLNTAETLYRQNGQPELAQQVAAERQKLQ